MKRKKRNRGGAFGSARTKGIKPLSEHQRQLLALAALEVWLAHTSGDIIGKSHALGELMMCANRCRLSGPVLIWDTDTAMRAGFLKPGTDQVVFDLEIQLSEDSAQPAVSMSSATAECPVIPFEFSFN